MENTSPIFVPRNGSTTPATFIPPATLEGATISKRSGLWPMDATTRNGTSMASTHKKVIVRKIDRDSVQGYVAAEEFLVGSKVEVLNTAGNVVLIELGEIKGVYFVRDFGDPSSLPRKTFTTRPRVEGLWVRLRFRDAETLEGLMPNDLTQVRAEGFFLNPPDTRGNVQRIFVPRSALTELTVLAVIGSAAKRRRQADAEQQTPLLFSDVPAE